MAALSGYLVGQNGSSESLAQEEKKGPTQRYDELANLAGNALQIVEHCRFLALPVGPWSAARRIDRIAQGGLFQYIVGEKYEQTDIVSCC